MSAERLAEIQARVKLGWPFGAEEYASDVPFLLAKLEELERERSQWRTEEVADLRAMLAASEAEAARLRKLFDDAGQGEHNVLALVEHYQREALASEAAAGQMRAALAKVKPFVSRAATPDTSYGGFYGGDPRNFSPDPECSTETERAAHAAACAEWDKGNEIKVEADRCHWLARMTETAPLCSFGLGSTTERDLAAEAARDALTSALATDCGRGWLSPEEAEQKDAEIARLKAREVQPFTVTDAGLTFGISQAEKDAAAHKEVERLRKELENEKKRSDALIELAASQVTEEELYEAETKDLRWVASALRESLEDPAKERWRAKNAELLEAIEAELGAR